MTDRHLHGGPSCTTILVVRDPATKGLSFFSLSVPPRAHVTNLRLHDGPSCTTVLVVRDPATKDLSFFF